LTTVIGPLELVRGNVPERFQQAPRVVPRVPLQRGELDVVDSFPRPAPVNHLRLIEPDDGLCERIVIRIARAADRRLDLRFREALGVPDRQILGGFKRSSQHLTGRGCDDYTETAFGAGRASQVALARPPLGWAASGAAPVLGGDRGGTLE